VTSQAVWGGAFVVFDPASFVGYLRSHGRSTGVRSISVLTASAAGEHLAAMKRPRSRRRAAGLMRLLATERSAPALE